MHQPALPAPGQKQDHKVCFKAKRHHGGSCQKEHVEDETVGEVGFLSPHKTGGESMLVRSRSDTEIAVEPTAEEAFLQAHFWKHTPCQGPHWGKAANLLFPSAVDCCSCSIASRWKEALELTQGTPRGHGWTNWSFRCAPPHSCRVPSLLLPRICQITVWDGLAGTPACSWLSQVNTHCQGDVLSLETAILPLLVSHPTRWESVPLAREQASRQRRSSGAEHRQHQEKEELSTTTHLWVSTTRIRPLRRQPPAHLFIIRCLMHN